MRSYSRIKHSRFVGLFYFTVFLFICLVVRLVYVQIFEHNKLTELAKFQHTGEIQITALRGAVYDRNGSCLAFSITLPSVAANPSQITDPEKTAECLSMILGIDKKELLDTLRHAGTFAWISRKIDRQMADRIEKLALPGIFIVDESSGKRFHPKHKVASHVLGYTGIDDQGLDGVEAMFEKELAGKHGLLQTEMDQRGRVLPGGNVKLVPSVPGKDLYLTIDETIQFIVEKELAKTVKKYNAAGGTVIVYNPRNGDILALANMPDYVPSKANLATKVQVRNKALCDSYEPGSTFKVILAATALDSGKATDTDRFFCGQSIEVGGYSIRNADDGLNSPTGTEDIEGVITYSFNVGAVAIGLKVGTETYWKYLENFGFGKVTGVELPGETEGIVTPGKYWKPINLATISYGQGIAVTPMQMVQAFGAIANEGKMMKPRIIKRIAEHNGKADKDLEPVVVTQVLKPKTCHQMLKILKNVCENGTGKKAKIPGYNVGGKTGTANVVKNGIYVGDKYIASFIGIVPVEDPQLVILVKIDEPKGIIWGGSVAAPVFNHVGSQILWRLGIRPSDSHYTAELPGDRPQGSEND